MKAKGLSILILSLTCCYSIVRAQTFDTRGAISPPVFNTGFMKAIHTGVNQQTGSSSIKIPLFSLKIDDDSEIPITIAYEGSGIKYEQPSGEIGVGWNISSNYRITRTIYNRPDEFFSHPTEYEIYDSLATLKNRRDQYLTRFTFGLPTNGGQNLKSNQTMLDGEYDLFDYITPFFSGTFVIKDVVNKTVLSPNNTLAKFDFVHDADGIRSFTMKDTKGNKITAGIDALSGGYMSEFTYTYPGNKSSYAWPVTKIQMSSGKAATFSYILKTISEGNYSGERAVRIIESVEGRDVPSSTQVDDINDGTTAARTTYLTEYINSSYGRVRFFRSGSAQMIDSVILYNNWGEITKKAIFYRSYSLGYSFLDSLIIFGSDKHIYGRYQFDYYDRSVSRLTPDMWDNLRSPAGDEPNTTEKRFPKELGNEIYKEYHPDAGSAPITYPVSFAIGTGADRSPREIPDYLSLKKITLPTGGYVIYEYDANYYNSGGQKKQGPGVRVSKVTSYDAGTNKLLETSYAYGINGNGTGEIPIEITPNLYGLYQVMLYNDIGSPFISFYAGRLLTFSNTVISDSDPYFTRYNVVSYPVVKETSGNGSTWYYYRMDSPGIWTTTRQFGPAFAYEYNLWAKSVLEKIEYYDNAGALKRTEGYNYGVSQGETLLGVKVKPYALFASGFTPPEGSYFYNEINSIYDYGSYAVDCGSLSLLSKETSENVADDSISSKTTYTYNNDNQLIKETYYSSDSVLREIQYTYANDLSGLSASDSITQDIVSMQDKNMTDNWIERRSYRKDPSSGSLALQHAEFRSFYQGKDKIRQSYFFNAGMGVSNFSSVNVSAGKIVIDSRYEKSPAELLHTDPLGNVLSMTNEEGIAVAYLWGYDHLYPIAEVKNAEIGAVSYLDVDPRGELIGNIADAAPDDFGFFNDSEFGRVIDLSGTPGMIVTDLDIEANRPYQLVYWDNNSDLEINNSHTVISSSILQERGDWKLRRIVFKCSASAALLFNSNNGLIKRLTVYPEDAQMTTYTYDPLVGMTSSTDAAGRTTYYEYDGFGRLKVVSDPDKQPVQRYDYHYREQ